MVLLLFLSGFVVLFSGWLSFWSCFLSYPKVAVGRLPQVDDLDLSCAWCSENVWSLSSLFQKYSLIVNCREIIPKRE